MYLRSWVVIGLLLISTVIHAACTGNRCPSCPAEAREASRCPPPDKTQYHPCPSCCQKMGGVQYCDKSSGRFVCNNGFISSCYCDRHAVMNLQKIEGCCLWQGGVLQITDAGLVICNNGSVSETCTRYQNYLKNPHH